ncbi:30S ribosomal protein S8 [Candidatus Legionella polyplacis]|uniref:30S ribosomal protein S8 n=1 Tax=Candidatus Legionella polyplacis TaxID=2005262 RepID=UPI000C1EF00C|nr:30S ribosomal protein S8 [Candidatus Legionella polyplacis]ATW01753.1 30S ribosomal protein S8 [Candidatus Legionella polyplacis]
MTIQDPISDMLTRIRNGQRSKCDRVVFYYSKLKEKILLVLKEEGFILDYNICNLNVRIKSISVVLKYYKGRPVIDRIFRVSKPGLRIYKKVKDLYLVPGFGILIMSTSKGVISSKIAKKYGIGGEIICEVS